MVGGAVAGGLLGRAIAGRRDNRAAILGGAALGGLAGSALLHQPPRSRDRAATGPVPERDRALAEFRRRQAAHALNLRRFRELQEAAPRP